MFVIMKFRLDLVCLDFQMSCLWHSVNIITHLFRVISVQDVIFVSHKSLTETCRLYLSGRNE